MKRLLSNKGNLLFTTAMCLVVAMLGFSLLTLIASTKERADDYSASLYERYTKESYGKIATHEFVEHVVSAETTVQFSPLEDSRDTQLHLQEALISTFLADDNQWKYNSLLPTTVTAKKTELTTTVNNLNTLLVDDLDLQHTQVLNLGTVTLIITMEDYTYSVNLEGLRIVYTFSNNKVHCRYNTDKVTLVDAELIRNTRRIHA